MATQYNSIIRLKKIDECLRNRSRVYNLPDLITAISNELESHDKKIKFSDRTIYDDLKFLKDEYGPFAAPIWLSRFASSQSTRRCRLLAATLVRGLWATKFADCRPSHAACWSCPSAIKGARNTAGPRRRSVRPGCRIELPAAAAAVMAVVPKKKH
jgi:hypothetical protein